MPIQMPNFQFNDIQNVIIPGPPQPMPNPNQEYEDFSQRYHNTFLKIVGGIFQVPTVAIVKDMKQNPGGGFSVYFGSSAAPKMLTQLEKDEFKIVEQMPTSKYVNWNKEGVALSAYYSRIPERQYKRGCCHANMQIHPTMNDILTEMHSYGASNKVLITKTKEFYMVYQTVSFWGYDSMDFLFDPKYPSFVRACNLLFEWSGLCIAFSQYYCVTLSNMANELNLCRKNVPIATIRPAAGGNFLIKASTDLFKQEILDLIRRGVITNSILV